MNVWGHMVVGQSDPEHRTGQFLGDFFRGPVEHLPLTPGVREGIQAHRRVDARGDPHSFTHGVKAFLEPAERRYGGLVLDVLCDWLLHENWDRVCSEAKQGVILDCETLLESPGADWPDASRHLARILLDHDLFHACAYLSEIRYTVGRLGCRLRRPVNLVPLLDRMLRHERWLHAHFPAYFEDMRRVASSPE